MEPAEFIPYVRRETAAFSRAFRAAAAATPIEHCPGWTAADLARHLGGVHRMAVAGIGSTERAARPAGPADDAAVADWYDESAAILIDALENTPPDTIAWSFGPGPKVFGFWFGREALETVVHRWDIENASGTGSPIETNLALEGLAEVEQFWAPARLKRLESLVDGRLRLVPQPTPAAADRGSFTFGEGSPVVTIRGDATSLYLLTWGRLPVDESMTVEGDPALLDALLHQRLTA